MTSTTPDDSSDSNKPKHRRFIIPRDHGINSNSKSVKHVPTDRDDNSKHARTLLQRKIKTK